MAARCPPVWCADTLVNIDPCAPPGAAAAAEAADFPRKNDLWDAQTGTARLAGAAGEVLDFQLVLEKGTGPLESVRLEGPEGFALGLCQQIAVPLKPLATPQDLNRERKATFGGAPPPPVAGPCLDDPLVPVEPARAAEMVPEISKKAPRLAGRKRQAFLVEIAIPRGAPRGGRELVLALRAGGRDLRLKIALAVHGFELPEVPACTADLNNYSRAPGAGYPGGLEESDRYRQLEREHFRMAREHRALFHLLPYSHSGRIEEGYAPVLSGRGRNRRVADWTPFDRHWGPYLDGSAFRGCPGGERPVEYLYLPVNLNWPAYFENFGTPGYELEFRNVLAEMARHFAERGWTKTKFEVFFNHKTRWKFFPWDMDEIRFDRDNYATILLARMAREAVTGCPQVRFVNRIDSSWIFKQSARTEMADLINLWVVNRTSHSESPDEVELLRGKGQEVWPYGGAGPIAGPNRLDNLRWPWIAWGRETDGFTWWNALGWGGWEAVGRGGDHCLYPGARFGLDGPLASLRLKVLRRGMQDHACLSLLAAKAGSRRAADEIVGRTIGAKSREDWYQRGEGLEAGGADIQTTTRTEKPWNTAPRAAWSAARAELARAIEKA